VSATVLVCSLRDYGIERDFMGVWLEGYGGYGGGPEETEEARQQWLPNIIHYHGKAAKKWRADEVPKRWVTGM
jgi:hypothetical protein